MSSRSILQKAIKDPKTAINRVREKVINERQNIVDRNKPKKPLPKPSHVVVGKKMIKVKQ